MAIGYGLIGLVFIRPIFFVICERFSAILSSLLKANSVKIYYTILFVGLSTILSAQEIDSTAVSNSDSTLVTEEVSPPTYFLTGASATFDYGKFALGFTNFESKFEVTGHVSVIKWQKRELKPIQQVQVSAEYGNGRIKPTGAYINGDYEVEGSYYRLGMDYTRSIDAKNNISLGMRYASGEFSDQGTITIESESNLYTDYTRSFARDNETASWWEFILITEGKLFRIYNPEADKKIYKYLDKFYIGGNVRLRFNLNYNAIEPSEDVIDIHTIPGYGRTNDNRVPAFNLFIKYRLDFK